MSPFTLMLAGALLLALVHLLAGKLRFLDVVPRSRWLSFASGMSVAYVFLRLLPELGRAQEPLGRAAGGALGYLEHHAYILAALGLVVFYGLERLAEESRHEQRRERGEDCTSSAVFWLHTGSFALFNGLIGYVLGEEAGEPRRYGLFLLAMALHFVVNDYGLRQHHKSAYRDRGRWVLAGAVVAGGVVGSLFHIPELYLLIPLSFIAGGVVLNVLKEELPRERRSRFGAFALGVASYGALLIAI